EHMKLLITSPSNYSLFLDENSIFPTVERWLGLYKKAKCIFTNTYHGMLFCIIFRKQFLFFVQNGVGAAENDRFYSLMSMLHLKDRMVKEEDASQLSEKMKKKIDYERVYKIIKEERIRTDTFFEKYGV
ncbi:MAG: polysaccharide pyruvyl transferase family protein, partial [Eubacteriales bacterium]|nr:polysaccharide pyruvyl transferase family protein [Eubacteriales bacterium]